MANDVIYCADLFCGAGGSSTGCIKAATALGLRLNLLAVNHWSVAVDTHTRNHPWARHLCADLSTIDPSKAIPGGSLDLLIASPECTHHSNARGGKPCSDQSRASAWHVLHWAERLRIRHIMLENVREFENWGPLDDTGRPDKRRKGDTFKAFVAALRSLGYVVDWRVLNAADYGDATSRRRLFIQAARHGKITWPECSHAGKWRPARDVIDWDLQGQSIFDRKRPLASRTLDRIEAGLRKFGGEPFIAVLRGTHPQHSGLTEPLDTISAGGNHAALCEPFLVEYHSEKPPGEARVASIDDPLPTQTTENRFGLCQTFVGPLDPRDARTNRYLCPECGNATHSKFRQCPCCLRGRPAACEPFIMQVAHVGSDHTRVSSIDDPLKTIPAGHRGEMALCEPYLVNMKGQSTAMSVDLPVPTITAGAPHVYLAQPFLTKYYGTAKARSVEIPLDTITAKDRFALCEPRGMDIRFRMLQPHELAAAMGFDGYEFAGTKTDQVRQIGNAVAVRTAQALCTEILRRPA